jgi:centromere/kinetochore protein ZW10
MGETTAGFDDLRQFIVSSLGSELDESAPLSASDLRILSQRIQSRSGELKDQVRVIYSAIHEQSVNVVRNSVTAASEVESVEKDLKRIDEYLGDTAFDIEICKLAAEAEQLRREQEERRQYIAGVEFIAEVHGSIQTAEKEFLRGDLVEAAAALCEIREQLGLPAEWTGDRDDEKERENKVEKVKAFILLEDEWAKCYAKVINDLL